MTNKSSTPPISLEVEDDKWGENMASVNHSIIQARLVRLLPNEDKFTIATELSLDITNQDLSQFIDAKEELKPDVCLYPSDFKLSMPIDLLKTKRMPLLAIEILSPRQLLEVVVSKFQAYFHLGVKSCWLVIPTQKTITIYKPNFELRVFDKWDSEIVDELLGFSVPTGPLFK